MTNEEVVTQKEEISESQFRTYLIKTLEIAEAELGSDIPVSTLLILLKLNTKATTPMTQITKTSGLSPAGASRTVSTLAGFSKANRREIKKPYVELRDDESDRRYKLVTLTDYGRQFVNRLTATIY